MKVIILVLVLAAVVLAAGTGFRRAFFPPRELPRNRVRHLRIRLRLRLYPGRGHATAFELWLRWGRFAAFRRSGRCRRALSFWQRLAAGPDSYSVMVGRAHYRQVLRMPLEEHALIMAPPRAGKTGWLARVILRYPGAVVSTSTKADVFELTSGIRSQRGPVHVFNPQGIGGLPSTFRWNPLEGCQDPVVAIRRADGFAHAISMGSVEDASFWSSKASDYLRAMFCAAALTGTDLRAVARWILGNDATEAEEALTLAGFGQWSQALAEMRGEAQKTAATVRMTMSRALAFLTDPALLSCVLPGAGGLDIDAFLRDAGTLYLIAESRNEHSPLAPLFAALAGEIHYQAAQLAGSSPGGRLDPPVLFALDEITQTCPVPLPVWLADAGGKGIQIIPVIHGGAQLAARWRDHGKQIVLDTCGVKIFLPGISDTTTLETASKLTGKTAAREHGQQHDMRHPVMEENMIRELPPGFALVIRGGLSPVIARLPAAWRDPAYKRAAKAGAAIAEVQAAKEHPPVPELAPGPELVPYEPEPPAVASNGHGTGSHDADGDFPWTGGQP
jgi:type IV secretion system protein VirD4